MKLKRHSFEIPAHSAFEARTTGEYALYLEYSGVSILFGPDRSDSRRCTVEQSDQDRVAHIDAEEGVTVVGQTFPRTPDLFYPDPTPLEVPLGMKAPPSMEQLIQAAVRHEVSRVAQANGWDTFDEDQDFDIPEDDTPESQYQTMAEEDVLRRDYRAFKLAQEAAKKAMAQLPPPQATPLPTPAPATPQAPAGGPTPA